MARAANEGLKLTVRSTNIGDMGRISDAKDKLIASAVELIYARSYAAVGVQEICVHAGVKKGSFYHFFPSKRDLTLSALEYLREGLRERILKPAFSPDVPPLQRLDRLMEMLYRNQQKWFQAIGKVPGCPFGNLAAEMSTQDEVLRARLDSIFSETERHIETALKQACAQNLLPEIDTEAAAKAIFAYMEGLFMLAKTENNPERIRQLGKAAIGLARSMERQAKGGEADSVG